MFYDLRRFPRAAYPYWKWPLLLYILWLLLTHILATIYTGIVHKMDPVCSTPWIGRVFPLCAILSSPPAKTIDISKVSTSQREFEQVINSAGKTLDLAMEMWGKDYVVRDLNIRVQHSELKNKKELSNELDSLVALNEETWE